MILTPSSQQRVRKTAKLTAPSELGDVLRPDDVMALTAGHQHDTNNNNTAVGMGGTESADSHALLVMKPTEVGTIQDLPVESAVTANCLKSSILSRMDALKSTSAVITPGHKSDVATPVGHVVRVSYDSPLGPTNGVTDVRQSDISGRLSAPPLTKSSTAATRQSLAAPESNGLIHTVSDTSKSNDSSSKRVSESSKQSKQPGSSARMVVPEKASSFNIHPGRCCSDVCQLCFTKFGLLDTPQHLSQIKVVQMAQRIDTELESLVQFIQSIAAIALDACLCDRCFRFLDRSIKARNKRESATQGLASAPSVGPDSQSSDLVAEATVDIVDLPSADAKSQGTVSRGCIVRNCARLAYHNVVRKWLVRLRGQLADVDIDWAQVEQTTDSVDGQPSTKRPQSLFLLCGKHSDLVSSFMKCTLCHAAIQGIRSLGSGDYDVESLVGKSRQQGAIIKWDIPPKADGPTNSQTESVDAYSESNCSGDQGQSTGIKKPKKRVRATFGRPKHKAEMFHAASRYLNTRVTSEQLGLLTEWLISSSIDVALTLNSFICKLCKLFCITQCRVVLEASKSHCDTHALIADSSHRQFYTAYRHKLVSMYNNPTDSSDTSAVDGGCSGSSPDLLASEAGKKPSPKIMIRLSKCGTMSSTDTTDVENGPPGSQSRPSQPVASKRTDSGGVTVNGDVPEQSRMRKRRRQQRPFASPSAEDRLHVELGGLDYHQLATEGFGGDSTVPCSLRIQMDAHTKRLWQEMQHPYSSATALFRHLLLLEKYWRNGDLVVSDSAPAKSMAYLQSVHKRVNAYTQLYRRSPEELSDATLPDKPLGDAYPEAKLAKYSATPLLSSVGLCQRQVQTNSTGSQCDQDAPSNLPNVEPPDDESHAAKSDGSPHVTCDEDMSARAEASLMTMPNGLSANDDTDGGEDDVHVIDDDEMPEIVTVCTAAEQPPSPKELHSHPPVQKAQRQCIRIAKFASNPIGGVAVSDEAHNIERANLDRLKSEPSVNLTFNNSICEILLRKQATSNGRDSFGPGMNDRQAIANEIPSFPNASGPPHQPSRMAKNITNKSGGQVSQSPPVNLLNVGPNISVFRQQRQRPKSDVNPGSRPPAAHPFHGNLQAPHLRNHLNAAGSATSTASQSMDAQLMMLMRQGAANMSQNVHSPAIRGPPPPQTVDALHRRGPSILRRTISQPRSRMPAVLANNNTSIQPVPVAGGRCLVLPNGLTVSASNGAYSMSGQRPGSEHFGHGNQLHR